MNRRILGRTDLAVSELCLGTLNFGWKLDRETSFDILDRFHEAGGNFVQAPCIDPDLLPSSNTAFQPETCLGEWRSSRNIRREDWVVSTRLTLQRAPGPASDIIDRVQRSCEQSLARLGIDCLDLFICEWTPAFLPLDDLLIALTGLIRQGKIRHFGLAGFPAWRVMESIGRAATRNTCRVEMLQADYSLLRRQAPERDLLDLCRDYRLGFLARSPLAGGFLASALDAPGVFAPQRRLRLGNRHDTPHGRAVLAEVATIARNRGIHKAQVALAWCLSDPAVTAVVIGAAEPAHLQNMVESTRVVLTPAELARLDAVAVSPLQNRPTATRASRERKYPGPVVFN